MNEIYSAACKANGCTDILLSMYEISSKETEKAAIISPCWKPHKVFPEKDAHIECVSEHTSFATYKIHLKKQNAAFSWIYCSPGASNVIDATLSLTHSDAEHILFVGSAGTLTKNISVGQIVLVNKASTIVPTTAILDSSRFYSADFESVCAKQNALYHFLKNKKHRLQAVNVFQTPSIICEYYYKDFLKERGFQCIEMETHAFLSAAPLTKKEYTALLCISDEINSTHALLNRDSDTRNKYLNSRHNVLPSVISDVIEKTELFY